MRFGYIFSPADGEIAMLQHSPTRIAVRTVDDVALDDLNLPLLPQPGYPGISQAAVTGAGAAYLQSAIDYKPDTITFESILVGLPAGSSKPVALDTSQVSIVWANPIVDPEADGLLSFWALTYQGEVAIAADWDSYVIEHVSMNGAHVRTDRMETSAQPFPESIAKWFAEHASATMTFAFGRRMEVGWMARDRSIHALVPRPDGSLWVLPSNGLPMVSSRKFATYDVWSTDGALTHRLEVTAPRSVNRFRDKWIIRNDWLFLILGGGQANLQYSVGGNDAQRVLGFEALSDAEYMTLVAFKILE